MTMHRPHTFTSLTSRELEVLKLLARGLSNPEIAAEPVVSDATAKTHVAHVLMKLGVRDRVQTVVFAYESGVVVPGAEGQARRHGAAPRRRPPRPCLAGRGGRPPPPR
jgi:DNA-binding CsgD family transcriptional regulator